MEQRIDELKWENISYLYIFYFIPPAIISPSYECLFWRGGSYHIPKTYTAGWRVVLCGKTCGVKWSTFLRYLVCRILDTYLVSRIIASLLDTHYTIPYTHIIFMRIYVNLYILYTRTHKKKFDYEFSFDIKNYLFYS